MKKRRLIDIREYTKEGWYELRPPLFNVHYHKYGSEETTKCSLIKRLQVALGCIMLYDKEPISPSRRLKLCARVFILILAQELNLSQRIVSRLSTSNHFGDSRLTQLCGNLHNRDT